MKNFTLESLAALAKPEKKQEITKTLAPVYIPEETPKEISKTSTSIDYKEVDVTLLVPFENQPFKPYTGERFSALCESIRGNGILTPLIVRPFPPNYYQIISGHNRARAAKEIGLTAVPVVIKNLDDDTAWIELIETNLNQRDSLLPSEKAFAYKFRLEAIKHQGKSLDIDNNNGGHDVLKSRDVIANDESGRNVQRYIRLTYLLKPLLDLVDEEKVAMIAGVELSYLTPSEQGLVYEFFFSENNPMTVSVQMSQKLRELAKEQELTTALLESIFSVKDKGQPVKKEVKIPLKKLKKIVPTTFDPNNIETLIYELLESYFKDQKEV